MKEVQGADLSTGITLFDDLLALIWLTIEWSSV